MRRKLLRAPGRRRLLQAPGRSLLGPRDEEAPRGRGGGSSGPRDEGEEAPRGPGDEEEEGCSHTPTHLHQDARCHVDVRQND
ncbi:hypothetical protein NHX12_028961 [Muraenolepis orangiensis]|uniref:Uncharacterized protein n=1 Tax=Muraenolepis orangiensis TaxID=630683 RepID=A0A9Q0EF54_9TELE|nr:hypothetical protein NHX12_028961 [Muraenolepis orangiensis]